MPDNNEPDMTGGAIRLAPYPYDQRGVKVGEGRATPDNNNWHYFDHQPNQPYPESIFIVNSGSVGIRWVVAGPTPGVAAGALLPPGFGVQITPGNGVWLRTAIGSQTTGDVVLMQPN